MSCKINNFSSRVCEKGTKSCDIHHNELKLKKCPFCGGEAEIYDECSGIRTITYFAECNDCGAVTAWSTDKDAAIKAWNTRVNDD